MLSTPRFIFKITAAASEPSAWYSLTINDTAGIPLIRDGDFECMVWGEVYASGAKLDARTVLARLVQSGAASAAKEMDGSFFILLLDHAKKSATAISDITASRKVFQASSALSDTPAGLGLAEVKIDPAGLAECLLNGVPGGNRTIYDGVKFFPRSSVGTLDSTGMRFTPYWSYDFDDAFAGRGESELIREFGELLVEGSRLRSAQRSGPILISLSGGYDSTCILGSLMRNRDKKDIVAFSYAYDPAQEKTDAAVARETCRRFGVEHVTVRIPELGLGEIIAKNALHGFSTANLCGEIGVWETIAEQLRGYGPRPVCFFGDNAFGHDPNWRISTVPEMLAWLPMAGQGAFDAIAPLLNPAHREEMRAAFGSAVDTMLASAARVGGVPQQRDYLYFDERVIFALVAWRHFFCGLHLEPVNPLLDKGVLDFYRHLPYSMRRARYLYKKTVRDLFPELLSSRRAVFYGSSMGTGDLLRSGKESLGAAAKDLSAPLAEWLSGEAVSQRLLEIANRPPGKESFARKITKILLKGSAVSEMVRSFSSRSYHVDSLSVVIRALVANEAVRMLSGK